MEFMPQAFEALKAYKQFIVFMLTPSKIRIGKNDKFPINYQTGQIANAHDSAIWLDVDSAIAQAKRFGAGYGVGFVFTENDPFWFLDIDDCLEPCNTKWSDLALSMCAAFKGAAIEVSSSGRGLHVIGTGKPPLHSCRNSMYKMEYYTSGRFVALTGFQAAGNAGLDCTPVLAWLVQYYFSKSNETTQTEWTSNPLSEWNGPQDDEVLIDRALRSQSSRSAFGGGASFADLWDANAVVLAQAYPDPDRGIGYNESSADAGLAQHLAFWTGNDCERMRRLMSRSALRRDKWEREDYLPRTILGACGRQKEWLSDKLPQPIENVATSQADSLRAQLVQGSTFLTIEQQIDVFAGCVYVADEHKALIPGGYLLNPERFRVMFGGYSLPMDNKNERVSRNAWECFTESQAFRSPRADSSCFKPILPPGTIVTQENQRLVNTWWPITTPRIKGDASPFLNLIALIAPDKNDQLILLSYLAALVQYQGIKFQWCPVIQGVQGNGKTLLTRCVAFAIGNRYSHFPKAAEIDGKFNDWLYMRNFIGVEDIYVPDSRLQVMEAMKPMITAERQEIEPKGGAKVTRDICANFLINTNHKDGIRKTQDDRRFAPFYTAQQSVADLKRDGMIGNFFPNLYKWLEKSDGYPIVNELFWTFEIPDDYNPATLCRRAPHTTSTNQAIVNGLGNIEQEILECIAQSLPGFKNGWVSSMALDRLFDKLNANRRIPRNKRRELMVTLGYDWHPTLKDGRVNRNVMPDNGKPRLYIEQSHADRHIPQPFAVAQAYEDAQK